MNARFSTDRLPADVISFRQALFLATGGGMTAAGIWIMADLLDPGGISPLEGVLLALFAILFGQIAFGFAIAFWGFVVTLRGDKFQILNALPPEDPSEADPGSTAIVMPVYNEEVSRVFKGMENMVVSLRKTGRDQSFDFFILSDSNNPDRWIEEECAWGNLCTKLGAFGRIFYRKRRLSLHGKSGNIADFCRRWGGRYRYLIILDADSLMTGETLVRLARLMDANPKVGIIQTAPQLIRGTSVLQRLLQFSTRLVGPIFAAGSNFWHLAGGNYWGHNAIIRLRPFMEHCVLPELPTRKDRHILSHDTVEAALMQQAGYQVWLAHLAHGSYEEGPPNLNESLQRDRRWCQGNLQHFWFLFAPQTRFTNRIHMFFGLMAYLTAPLLVVFIALGAFDHYGKQKFAMLSAADPALSNFRGNSALLLGLTLILLFLPKLLGFLLLLRNSRPFGGPLRAAASTALETAASVLLAPLLLYFYTKFTVLTLLGLRVVWKTQNRADSRISTRDALRDYLEPTLLGLAGAALAAIFVPELLVWLSPILLGWCLAVPLAMVTSSNRLGLWLRKRGLLLIPEEQETPAELQGLDDIPAILARSPAIGALGHYGILMAVLAPYANAIHVMLLRRSKVRTRHKQEHLDRIQTQLLEQGPDGLARRDLMALLWDPEAASAIHREVWRREEMQLHSWWRQAMHGYNEASLVSSFDATQGLSPRRNTPSLSR